MTGTEVVVTQSFEHYFYSDHINRPHSITVNFLLVSRRKKTLNFAFWSWFLVERLEYILKTARSIMYILEFLHISVKLPSRVKSCWHLLTH